MPFSEAQARNAINRTIAALLTTAHRQVEARREALRLSFLELARSLWRDARARARPLDAAGRAALRARVEQAVTRVGGLYTAIDADVMEFVRHVTDTLTAVHVEIAQAASDDLAATQRASDDLMRRTQGVPERVRDELASLRRERASIAGLAERARLASVDTADGLLAAAVEAGVSERDVTADLATLLLGNDVDYTRYGLERPEVTPLRGMIFAASALVVSETFNALRGASSATLAAMGLARTGLWTLSARHASLRSSPDVCDTYATRPSPAGPGRYPVDQWPVAPHPYCGCYMSDVRLTEYGRWSSQWA